MNNVTVIGLEQQLSSIAHYQISNRYFLTLIPGLVVLSMFLAFAKYSETERGQTLNLIAGLALYLLIGWLGINTTAEVPGSDIIYALQAKQDQIKDISVSGYSTVVSFEDGSFVECKDYDAIKNPSNDGSIILDVANKQVLY